MPKNLSERETDWALPGRLVVPAAGFLVLAVMVFGACSNPERKPIRIVLVTLDTLRFDGLDPASDRPTPMSETASLANEGTVFSRHFAATSTTEPTHASLMTGLHPWQHGVTRNGQVLGPEVTTIAERLQEAGFSTAAVVASFPLHRIFGFSQGFDTYSDEFTEPGVEVWSNIEVPDRRFRSMAPVVSARALQALDRAGEGDQFFWFHFFDPHSPYGDLAGDDLLYLTEVRSKMRKEETLGEALSRIPDLRRAYDRDLEVLDSSIAGLLGHLLEGQDVFETHIVVVSDHGESFGEGGSVGHGTRLTSEQIHVPCFIISPLHRPGMRDDLTGSVDIAATILGFAGIVDVESMGSDLVTVGGADRAVVGMRRTFEEPKSEVRTDGRLHQLPEFQFFRIQGRQTVIGDRSGAAIPGGDRENFEESRHKILFGTFEDLIRGVETEELRDEATIEALRALGYVR